MGASRRLTAVTAALALAVVAGPLAVPSAAESGADGADGVGGAPSALPTLPVPADVISAGTTGFLSIGQDSDLLWTRYAGGATTPLGRDIGRSTATLMHGSVSDVVALERGTEYDTDHRVELHDMGTGDISVVPLGRNRSLNAVVGSTVVACRVPYPTDATCTEAHLMSVADGVTTDRVVTGLPSGAFGLRAAAATTGALALSYKTSAAGGTTADGLAVVDLASGTATTSHLASAGFTTAVSPAYVSSVSTGNAPVLSVENRATGTVTRLSALGPGYPLTGLVGNWAVFGPNTPLGAGSADWDFSLRAVPVGGGAVRKVLDHATTVVPAPDGAVLVTGGTVAKGEGVYRVSVGPDGAPVADMVASKGAPTKLALLSSSVPAVATLDPAPWKARWQLSRSNAEVTLTLRHTATGAVGRWHLDRTDNTTDWVRMDWAGRIFMDWTGGIDSGSAPNGAYTWQITAKPYDNLGPTLNVSGGFTVARPPAPHDYTDNGSPDILARDSSGALWREDTVYYPGSHQLTGSDRVKVGPGWNVYSRIVAVGNVAGSSAGDLIARDSAGVLWLYTGTGKGTFAARTKIGPGWNIYTQITGTGDFTGDGRADLVARDGSGALWLYRGTGNAKAPYATRTKIGPGWNIYKEIVAVGNIAGSSAGDLIARDNAGMLWLYTGKGNGTFAPRTKIGPGWNIYTQMFGIGDSNVDGKPDLITRDSTGTTWRYLGTGNAAAPFAKRELTGVLFAHQYNTAL
ncbi:FG-GAP-like repeat-containing protein [Streptomyces sp. NPDC008139]|uniref:FG-GAP repeat domain-containing protein n=1 Tax=Streptomyces sp. NPDC008139 TaxID=3364814 RepID=UPI0036F018C3